MLSAHETLNRITSLFKQKDKKSRFLARQLLFLNSPLSKLVELYLFDNEGLPQKLDNFPMMRAIYDNLPKKLLLKCSRKTLKSTLISNIITLNMIRFNNYHMLYVSPFEQTTKRFSHDYLSLRLTSPPLSKVITKISPNDVYVKGVTDSNSNIILTYANDDPTRVRGIASSNNYFDEAQGMNLDILPIINETMAISKIQREVYSGTPLTTDNTLNNLWQTSNQMEWVMKCSGCNHWNSLSEDNEPMKMIQKKGLCCSKCGKVLNSRNGQWADFNPGIHDIQGFHLAQPILPHYNQDPEDWGKIYNKCYGERAGSILEIYNEVFGLAYDIGSKPITEAKLKSLCVLGDMKDIYRDRGRYYNYIVGSADWGVSGLSSRTVFTLAGMRGDGIMEVFYYRIFKNTDYEAQIREIAEVARYYQPNVLTVDSGPDPIRGKMLGNLYDPARTQLVAYREGLFVQYFDMPKDAQDWSQARWCLSRSEVIGFTFDLLHKNKILFPRWEDSSEGMQDILSVFIEIKEGDLKSNIFYRHKNPDDMLHTLTWAACACHLWAGNSFFSTI